MKKLLLFLTALFLLGEANAFDVSKNGEVIFKAMQDEMARTMKDLKTKGMAKPYYAAYKVQLENSFARGAFMGEKYVENDSSGDITISVMLRVGDKKIDNSFFENTVLSTAERQLPSLSYASLRRALWLQTDDAYKQALDQYTKKLAYLKKKQVKQENPDFSQAEISSDTPSLEFSPFDKDYITSLAEKMSKQGDVKSLKKFSVFITVEQGAVFFLSSEGAKYVKDDSKLIIILRAEADTPEGFPLEASKKLSYQSQDELPSKEELIKTAKDFSEEMQAAVLSPKGEAFIGPVLLEDQAAAYLFANLFANNITNTKKTLSLNNDKDYNMGEFARKKGLKVMPFDFNVVDDPEAETFKGKKLAGFYKVDDEGVRPSKLQIVKDGKLTELPATRSSGKTNGHARLGLFEDKLYAKAAPSNLFFLPQKTLPKEELKTRLMRDCLKENLDYCYIIRRFDGANITAYKVDARTGEETLTHGFEKPELSARTLRDIAAAGDDLTPTNYYFTGQPSYSIVAPSVILSEMELKPSQVENKKPPKLEKPQAD